MIEFFFDCSSPWTWLAFHQIQPLAEEEKATIASLACPCSHTQPRMALTLLTGNTLGGMRMVSPVLRDQSARSLRW
jgi:hypothetical protein